MMFVRFHKTRHRRGLPAAELVINGVRLWFTEHGLRRTIAAIGPRLPLMYALGMYLLARDEMH